MIDPSKLGEMMQQAQEIQQRMQAELRSKTVQGQSGGGMVKVAMNGVGEVTALKIEPSVVDPKDVAMLEDLVRAAVNDATSRIEEVRMNQARSMAGSFGLPPGMM